MHDRNVEHPNRYRMVKVEGTDDIYDIVPAPGRVDNNGTLINKATLLKDSTAAKFGLGSDAVPDDAINALSLIIGNGAPTTETAGAIGQKYYNQTHRTFYVCVGQVYNGIETIYAWSKTGDVDRGGRGPILFTQSGVLKLSDYELFVGDDVNVICIGGGGGGGLAYRDPSPAGDGGGYGGGGNGGSGLAVAYYAYGGGGGGGSGYAAKGTVTLNAEEIVVTIGEGGGPRQDGGTTSFGNLLSAKGGSQGGTCGTPIVDSGGSSGGGRGGAGGNPGGDGQTASCGMFVEGGAAGKGGNGYEITGTFIYETSEVPISGNGAVYIWY